MESYITKEYDILKKIINIALHKNSSLPIDSILDIGSNNGLTTLALSKFTNFIVGIDPLKNMIEQAIHNKFLYGKDRNIRFICSTIETLPYTISSMKYSFIMFSYSLHYTEDVNNSIAIAKDLLAPTGKILIILPNMFTLLLSTGKPPTKEWLFKRNIYKTLSDLQAMGYTKINDFKDFDVFII